MKTKPNEPMLPCYFTADDIKLGATNGLTKREHFTAMAMQGLLGSTNGLNAPIDGVCRIAVDTADMLIKYLNEKEVK